jgi:ATP-dependent DNA helicase RecG
MIPNEEPSANSLLCDQYLSDERVGIAEPDYPGQYPYPSLEEFLSLHEGRCLDFKETVSESFFKLLSAFSNTEGGFIILGVNDKTRRVVGFDCRGEKLSELANRISDSLGIHPVIDEIPADGRMILIITVSPQKIPISYRGVYYTRVGDTVREIDPDELRRKFLEDISWEDLVGDCTIDDIDDGTVRDFMDLIRGRAVDTRMPDIRDKESILRRLGLITPGGNITHAAYILFGKNPQSRFINTGLKITRINSKTVLINPKDLSGNLFQLLELAEDYLLTSQVVIYDPSSNAIIDSFKRKETPEYPKAALREALLNMLIHRDYFNNRTPSIIRIYDDRIQFLNPACFPADVTLEKILSQHYPYHRNPKIADIFAKVGYIEKFGTGLERIRTEAVHAGYPPPEFEYTSLGFNLILRNDPYTGERLHSLGLNERQITAVNYLKSQGSISNQEYQMLNNVRKATATRDLTTLVQNGILRKEGTTGPGVRYSLIYATRDE